MTFKEIERRVVAPAPMEGAAPLHEQMCYTALRNLYAEYRRGTIKLEEARQEKQRLRNAYEFAVTQEQTSARLCREWTDGLRVSDEFRIQLRKGLANGEGLETLFPLACTCIAVMTGDKTLLGSEVKRKLEEHAQLKMEGSHV